MDKQFLIRDLPPDVDHKLDTIAVARGIPKWKIIREALIEYASKHTKDIVAVARKANG